MQVAPCRGHGYSSSQGVTGRHGLARPPYAVRSNVLYLIRANSPRGGLGVEAAFQSPARFLRRKAFEKPLASPLSERALRGEMGEGARVLRESSPCAPFRVSDDSAQDARAQAVTSHEPRALLPPRRTSLVVDGSPRSVWLGTRTPPQLPLVVLGPQRGTPDEGSTRFASCRIIWRNERLLDPGSRERRGGGGRRLLCPVLCHLGLTASPRRA